MQTQHAGCSSRAKKSRPAQPPSLPRGTWRPIFNQLEPVTTCTYRSSLVKINACLSSYRGNRHRPPARPLSQTHTQDRLQYIAPQLASAQCNEELCRCAETSKRFIIYYILSVAEKNVVTGNHSTEHKCPVVHWTGITVFKRSQLD